MKRCDVCGHEKGAHGSRDVEGRRGVCCVLGCACIAFHPTREGILAGLKKTRAGIEHIFIDCEYWNRYVRSPGEELINPDPYGELRRLALAIDELLANDPGHGPLASLKFSRSQ